MKKTTLTIVGIVALSALVAVPFLYAQGPRHMRGAMGFGGFGGGHLAQLQQKLNLSDQQVSEIQAIFADLKTQNAPYRQQMRGVLQSVITTLLNDPNDVAGAQSIIDQQTAAKTAMQTNMLKAASKALNVLTPEQRTQLGQLIQQRMAKRAQRSK